MFVTQQHKPSAPITTRAIRVVTHAQTPLLLMGDIGIVAIVVEGVVKDCLNVIIEAVSVGGALVVAVPTMSTNTLFPGL